MNRVLDLLGFFGSDRLFSLGFESDSDPKICSDQNTSVRGRKTECCSIFILFQCIIKDEKKERKNKKEDKEREWVNNRGRENEGEIEKRKNDCLSQRHSMAKFFPLGRNRNPLDEQKMITSKLYGRLIFQLL